MTNPAEEVWSLLTGYRASGVANALVATGIADAMYLRTSKVQDVARSLDLDCVRTRQLLRAAAALGLVRDQGEDVFQLSEPGELLATDAEGSLAGPTRYFAGVSASAFTRLADSVKGGDAAFIRAHGKSFYEFLESDHEVATAYNDLIIVQGLGTAIAGARGFAEIQHVVDLGGGNGHTLAELMGEHSHLTGTLLELTHASAHAELIATEAHTASRVAVHTGNFLDEVPEGGDLYLICRVLPNLSDDEARLLLSNCVAAMSDGAYLLIVDMESPDVVSKGDFNVVGELQAMVHFGGRLRTQSDLLDLLEHAGLTFTRTYSLDGFPGFAGVEAIKAPK